MMAGRMRGNAAIPQWLELLCCLKNAIMEWPGGPGSDSDSAAFAFLPPIVEGPRAGTFSIEGIVKHRRADGRGWRRRLPVCLRGIPAVDTTGMSGKRHGDINRQAATGG